MNYLTQAISSQDTTITVSDPTSLPHNGNLIINRIDSYGNMTPSAMEVVSFTKTGGNVLRLDSRGLVGTGVKAHPTGSNLESGVYYPDGTTVMGQNEFGEEVWEHEHLIDKWGNCRHSSAVKLLINKKLAYDADGQACIRIGGAAHSQEQAVCLETQRMAEQSVKRSLENEPWKLEYHPIDSLKQMLENMI